MQIFLILSLLQPLYAEETSSPTSPKWSITFDSAQIAQNTLQVQQEYALRPKIGIGFSEGFGFHEDEVSYQMGLLSRYYLLGDFLGGVGVGGDFSYTTYIVRDQSRKVNGHLFAPSVSLTGKYIFDVGFTIEPSIGGRFSTLVAKSENQDSWISVNDWDWVLGLRLGWSMEPWLKD